MKEYKGKDFTLKYLDIIKNELVLKTSQFKGIIDINSYYILQVPDEQVRTTTMRILEIAKNSTVLRCGNITGHLTSDTIAYESDGAHTNLVRALVKYAMDYIYGWGANSPNFHRAEIDEAALIHDLPENITGDIPDNRNRDEEEKNRIENAYIEELITSSKIRRSTHARQVKKLLSEMQNRSSVEGRLLYSADKVSAVIMMLMLDHLGLNPHAFPGEESICKMTDEEVSFCTKQQDGSILLSDAWTIDYLHGRKLNHYDDYSFFTAILVMATLLIKGEWYDWRYKQYK